MIKKKVTPGMGVNCYLFACEKTRQGVVIDPGAGNQMLINWLKEEGYMITHILLTHGHYDHIGAVAALKKEFGALVAIHQDDAGMLIDPSLNLSCYIGQDLVSVPADLLLEDGQEIAVGEKKLQVIHTPGHSPGGICLLTAEGLFSGDTLFQGSVGRTDFPGGNMGQLLESIQTKLMILSDDLSVYPGHEGSTTIGNERRSNPYVNGAFV